MLLKDYIPNIKKNYSKVFFSGIAFDSSKVKKNNIFFAIKGNKVDGNDFVNSAIKKGAKVIISEKIFKKKKESIIFLNFSNVRKLLAEVSYKILNKSPKKFVAVTGTNGKSSIADFYYQILNLNFKKVASIGTIGVKHKNKFKNVQNTTLDPIQLSFILDNLIRKKIEYIIMEASSHGLKQNRLDGLVFDVGIFTNLSHDHLDYHKNMKKYLKSKLYLFERLIKKNGNIVTDANIAQRKKIENISKRKKIKLNLIFNKKKNCIELISHKFDNEKQILEIKFNNIKYKFELNLIGKIQIKNVLMAILAANKSGLKFEKIISAIHKIKPVEGRLEKIGMTKNNSKIILDYAHTPEALEIALLNLREQFPSSNINLVFGCGGNRDEKKRPIMGKIAEKYSDKIYLTDDNPRIENPSKIRKDIKQGIKKKIIEFSDRKKAINEAIMNLKTGEILLVAGKGHEKIQDYGRKKVFFSDRQVILRSIKSKNRFLSNNLKLNIIREISKSKFFNRLVIKNVCINSKIIKRNDIFFAIKGKKFDGNNFVAEALNKKSSLAIVNKYNKDYPLSKQVKVKNTLDFLNDCSSIFRENINTKIISITGSCGKTTLKEMMGLIFQKISRTTYSPKSFNNKYGVPLSLFNLKTNDHFGIFEVGMDKKGEIDSLTKIIKPDLGIITNISYAHSKNFRDIKKIAEAKAEIMNNIKKGGTIILNMDDNFYNYHKKFASKKKLRVISFGIINKSSMTKLVNIKKIKNKYELFINVNGISVSFYSKNDNKNNIYNILATLTAINLYRDIKNLKKNIFLGFKIPSGRGDIKKIKLRNKKFYLVDESYNSNPLSLKTAIENYDKLKIKSKKSKKYLILGDMLELGNHSLKQHKLISKIVNKTKINHVYVVGKHIKETFKGLKKTKKGKILDDKSNVIDFINQNLTNNDYLMIKGSNSTGLHKITSNLKQRSSHVI